MARPTKQGFDYFPLDVGFFRNKKINALRRAFGSLGILTYVNLLCRVYEQGFAYRFESVNSLAEDIAEDVGNGQLKRTTTQIAEIINYLVRYQMLDERLFQQNLISSVQIQEQYTEMAVVAKRKCVDIPAPLKAHGFGGAGESIPTEGVSSEKTPINSELTTVNSEFMPQSKVKKSKVKQSILYDAPEGAEQKNALYSFPLDRGVFDISQEDIDGWACLYDCDIIAELDRMAGWLDARQFRPTKERMTSFVAKWLDRACGREQQPKPKPTQPIASTFDTDDFFNSAVARNFGDLADD